MLTQILLLLGQVTWAQSGCSAQNTIPNEYLVRVKEPQISVLKNGSSIETLLRQIGAESRQISYRKAQDVSSLSFSSESPIKLLKVKAPDKSLAVLKSSSSVLSVEPNCKVRLFKIPDDAGYSQMWAHKSISSEKAWDLKLDASPIVVAVSDTGVDYNHEDLHDNMWVNTLEKNGKAGVDDDKNGYVDDIYGYDFANDDADPMPSNNEELDHGTHVAGIIGAVGDNKLGVVGVAWKVKIMAVKGFTDDGEGASLSDLIETLYYAVDNGANIINCSWGGQVAATQAEKDAVKYAVDHNVLIVAAAGNSSIDTKNFSPASIDGVLAVGAVNSSDQLSAFSNFGITVKIVAPGGDAKSYGGPRDENVFSTLPMHSGGYGGMVGTSMASPYVAGAAALVKSVYPKITNIELIQILTQTGDIVDVNANDAMQTEYKYPRLNVYKAVQKALALHPVTPTPNPTPKPTPSPSATPSPAPVQCTENCSQSGDPAGNTPPVANPTPGSPVGEAPGSGCSLKTQETHREANVDVFMILFLLPLLVIRFYKKN